jgi:hypothetical protein
MFVKKGKCYTAPVLFRTIVSKSGQLIKGNCLRIYDINNRNTNKYDVWHG